MKAKNLPFMQRHAWAASGRFSELRSGTVERGLAVRGNPSTPI
jgi:hypothetical protein